MAAADKANRAKSDFLSSMSHELRTPLNAILGFAQLLETGTPAPTPTQKRNIEQILKAGWYLLELINEVLDLALIESGRLTLSNEPVSLAEVLLECRAMIEPQAQHARHRHDISAVRHPPLHHRRPHAGEAGADQPAVQRDQVQPPAGQRGRGVRRCARPSIRISVRDTGVGLPPEQLDAAVPALQPARQGSQRRGRHRHRPGGDQAPGRPDGRVHRRRQHRRARAACSGSSSRRPSHRSSRFRWRTRRAAARPQVAGRHAAAHAAVRRRQPRQPRAGRAAHRAPHRPAPAERGGRRARRRVSRAPACRR